jgi:hypothetical protein
MFCFVSVLLFEQPTLFCVPEQYSILPLVTWPLFG